MNLGRQICGALLCLQPASSGYDGSGGSWLNTNIIQNENPSDSELMAWRLFPLTTKCCSPIGGGNKVMMKDDNSVEVSQINEIPSTAKRTRNSVRMSHITKGRCCGGRVPVVDDPILFWSIRTVSLSRPGASHLKWPESFQ